MKICSFCGNDFENVDVLIQCRNIFICDKCVDLCVSRILAFRGNRQLLRINTNLPDDFDLIVAQGFGVAIFDDEDMEDL